MESPLTVQRVPVAPASIKMAVTVADEYLRKVADRARLLAEQDSENRAGLLEFASAMDAMLHMLRDACVKAPPILQGKS
jgi:hypothetical protein